MDAQEKLRDRISNMRFKQALRHLQGQPDHIVKITEALAAMFGNCGWEDFDGHMATMLHFAVNSLMGKLEK